MARTANVPCAGACGRMLWGGGGSLPPGLRTCRECRVAGRAPVVPVYPKRGPARACIVEGCDGKHVARGMCRNHYRQAKCAEGDPSYMGGGTNNFRSKARRYGVAYMPIRKLGIFERDGWVCGICSAPVDRVLSWPDRLSASLDHIVPFARGGAHVDSNVQCSHLVCNIRKADRELEASWATSAQPMR